MQTEITRQSAQDGHGIFTADETAFLTEFFSHGGGSETGIAALPNLIDDHAELAEKVAALALEVVQERLPQWAATRPDGTVVVSRKVKRGRNRRVVVAPRHLFTINWANSAPGFPWPEAYHATFIPGFGRYVVTASRDGKDLYGCCDHAIGWFDAHTEWKESAKAIVKEWWAKTVDYDQAPWVELWDAASLGEVDAYALREAVWPEEDESEDEDQWERDRQGAQS
jgi:hypothetical protein